MAEPLPNATNFTDQLHAMNATTTSAAGLESVTRYVAVYGLPGYRFYLIHITGISALASSIVISAGTLVYLNYPCKKNFFSRSIGKSVHCRYSSWSRDRLVPMLGGAKIGLR